MFIESIERLTFFDKGIDTQSRYRYNEQATPHGAQRKGNTMAYAIRTGKGGWKGERMKVRTFPTADAMHKFLNTADNANHWRECAEGDPMKRGTYAWAGGAWHNVRNLDPTELAHL